MKIEWALTSVASVVVAAILVERYYHHPTYGHGVQAALAVAKAALAIG
jgi:hypothetical protein